MQRITPILFLTGGIVAVGLALGQSLASTAPAVAQDPVVRPAELALQAQVQELERKVATLETWVAAQQAQAKLTAVALAEAEAAGFTAGINYSSREILLKAWRAEAARIQEGGALTPPAVTVPKDKGDAGRQALSPPR